MYEFSSIYLYRIKYFLNIFRIYMIGSTCFKIYAEFGINEVELHTMCQTHEKAVFFVVAGFHNIQLDKRVKTAIAEIYRLSVFCARLRRLL